MTVCLCHIMSSLFCSGSWNQVGKYTMSDNSLIRDTNFQYFLTFLNRELRHEQVRYYRMHGWGWVEKDPHRIPVVPDYKLIQEKSWNEYHAWINDALSVFIDQCFDGTEDWYIELLKDLKTDTAILLVYYVGLSPEERSRIFKKNMVPVRREYKKAIRPLQLSKKKFISALSLTHSVMEGTINDPEYTQDELKEDFPLEMKIIGDIDRIISSIKELTNKRVREARLFPSVLFPLFEALKYQGTKDDIALCGVRPIRFI